MVDAANDEQEAAGGQENPVRKRQRSQLPFPYTDLQRAIELCDKLAELGGAGPVELTQLAASLNQTADGGTFRGRMSSAKLFGLVEASGDTAQLSKAGEDILDPYRGASAKVTAFLRVPLYEKLYSEYQGYALPPAAAIERKMALLGLPQKQVERARQVFASSVETAGFINSNGRFVKPVVVARGDVEDQAAQEAKKEEDTDAAEGNERSKGGGFGSGSGSGKDHPLINGLLITLPDPGTVWEQAERTKWLTMAGSIFDMIYKAGPAGRPNDSGKPTLKNTATDQ